MTFYSDKTILITGGAGGIGVESARVFLEAGARVRLVDRSADALERAAQALGAPEELQVQTNGLADQEDCLRALRDGPRPYALIHLAGISLPDPEDTADLTLFDETMSANVRNGYQLGRLFHAHCAGTAELPTRAVFACSLAFRRGGLDRIAYSAAKGAIAGMVRAMTRRFAPAVHVNAVAPGIILTPMSRQLIADRADKLMSEIPIRRFAEPREVATVIEFLCSPASSYVNGQIINVDGGTIHS
ncbi:SDR family NAD(P)-dependent oxidoreductase [Variovorax sp. RA8]|uniref:SDR family NAD(P)-dependent oxidoreductase n=1 Tax=Variovorax sp. (strain JCM 16519 / RA8) TaxID=662548 RepID=UPI001317ACD3|nr:SDR family oxidoreductase [Variovorax sp. RA8]VTU22836.1 3-oxoacyl-[acyl-carrier-protein] reductase FabG [Variovorax sp. RA8]